MHIKLANPVEMVIVRERREKRKKKKIIHYYHSLNWILCSLFLKEKKGERPFTK